MKRNNYLILGIILIFVAIGALPAGYSMIVEPDGRGLGMNLQLLSGSPFKDFFIPGLFLFGINGVLNLTAGILCFFKWKYASFAGLMLGTGLLIWISVQVYSVGLNHFLQPAYFLIGVAEIVLSLRLAQERDGKRLTVNGERKTVGLG